MRQFLDPHIAWAAGFFDGEGCVSIGKGTSYTMKDGTKASGYQLSIIVAQKYRQPLDLFVCLFGGRVRSFVVHEFTYFQWKVSGPHAVDVLEQILPYLTVKRKSAEWALGFHDFLVKSRPKPSVKRSEEDQGVLEAYYQQSKVLNARNSHKEYTEINKKETRVVQ